MTSLIRYTHLQSYFCFQIVYYIRILVVVSPKQTPHMSAIFILIACSLMVALGFLIAFIFSVKKGQYDDTYTPPVRMLFDNDQQKTNAKRQ